MLEGSLGCDLILNDHLIANLLQSVMVKESWKLVNIWCSCDKKARACFLLGYTVENVNRTFALFLSAFLQPVHFLCL